MISDHSPRPWRIDNRTWEQGARGAVLAEFPTLFGGITVRAAPSHLACPSREQAEREAMTLARLFIAAPGLHEALEALLNSIWIDTTDGVHKVNPASRSGGNAALANARRLMAELRSDLTAIAEGAINAQTTRTEPEAKRKLSGSPEGGGA